VDTCTTKIKPPSKEGSQWLEKEEAIEKRNPAEERKDAKDNLFPK